MTIFLDQGFPGVGPIDFRDALRHLNESDFLKTCYGSVPHRFRGVTRKGLFFVARNPQTEQDELMELHSESRTSSIR